MKMIININWCKLFGHREVYRMEGKDIVFTCLRCGQVRVQSWDEETVEDYLEERKEEPRPHDYTGAFNLNPIEWKKLNELNCWVGDTPVGEFYLVMEGVHFNKHYISATPWDGHLLHWIPCGEISLDEAKEECRQLYLNKLTECFTFTPQRLQTNFTHHTTFQMGEPVRKKSGSEWEGRVVGRYGTELTPEGYAVESSAHAGSVQIYPASALERTSVYDGT
jgi:dihydrofolate reductase (trimethoprim resistance protein)